jgi:hypothetical protein
MGWHRVLSIKLGFKPFQLWRYVLCTGKPTRLLPRILVISLLSLGLTACSIGGTPSQQIVEQALSIQVEQIQAELSRQLKMTDTSTSFSIHHVVVNQQQPFKIAELPGYQVQGTYDYTLKAPNRELSRSKNPFELYLQRQPENKTWRLARLQLNEAGESYWLTQRLPFADE